MEKRHALIDRMLEKLRSKLKSEGERIYLVGGSWRVIARLDMERRNYPLTVLHEYRMTPKSVNDTLDWIATSDLALLRARTGTGAERMELVPLACEVLREIDPHFQTLGNRRLVLRYPRRAAVMNKCTKRLRARDPLIEAARSY